MIIRAKCADLRARLEILLPLTILFHVGAVARTKRMLLFFELHAETAALLKSGIGPSHCFDGYTPIIFL